MTAALHFILIFEFRSEHAVSYWKRSLIFFQWDCVHHFPCYYYPFQYERWGCWGRLRARRECARRGARRKFKNRFSCVAGFFGCRSYNKNIFLSSQASAVPIHSSLSFVLFPFDAFLRKRLQSEIFWWRKSVSLSLPSPQALVNSTLSTHLAAPNKGTTGRKKYTPEFLLAYRTHSSCQALPSEHNIPMQLLVQKGARVGCKITRNLLRPSITNDFL